VSKLLFNGTAWLSSVRVVECNIKLFNERNPYRKFSSLKTIKDTKGPIPWLLNCKK